MQVEAIEQANFHEEKTNWSAVYAMSLCVFALITSEFLPVSLLTPIASDLAMTEGQAGQTIAVSGLFAVITSLLIATITQNKNRRTVMLALTTIMIISGTVVTFAPNYQILMVGRALLGIVIGGFWSLSTATLMRLLSIGQLPRGLVLLNAGNALAGTIAAPLGSFLGAHIGWRGAFFTIVPIACITLAWQFISLPQMPAMATQKRSGNPLKLLGHFEFSVGMLAIFFLFMGQFAQFTYLRPFLETVTQVSATQLSVTLFVIGVGGFVGTLCIGPILRRTLFPVLIFWPIILAILCCMFIGWGAQFLLCILLVAAWGFFGTSSSVGWNLWLTKVVPKETEQGGGLMVAIIQLAITAGAGISGILFDSSGYQSSFSFAAGLLFIAGVCSALAWWIRRHR